MCKHYELYQDNLIRKFNKIDWRESAKNHCSIFYKSLINNEIFCISLLENYNSERHKILVSYKGDTFLVSKHGLLNGYINSIIRKSFNDYKKSLNATGNNNYSVYCHVNKINNKIYIGITSQNPFDRWKDGKGYENQMFYRAIKKYGWDNFEHIILANELSSDVAEIMEIELIKKYNTTNPNYGYNLSTGGCIHKQLTLEERKNLSKKFTGRKLTDEWIKNRTIAQTGLKRSKETKIRIGNAHSIPIICINNRKIYKSLTEASKLTSIHMSHISSCCNKKRKSAGKDENGNGLLWMFYKEYINKEYDKKSYEEILQLESLNVVNGKHTPILHISTNKTYKSVPAASNNTGIGQDKIRSDLLYHCNEWRYITNEGI